MIKYFTTNYENDICDSLIEVWERDCKKEEEKLIKIFYDKEEWYLNNSSSGCRNATQSLSKGKKSQDSKNSRKWPETGTINSKIKKNNDSRSRSRSNNQHNSYKLLTNKTIINDKKEWPTLAEASKEERGKKRPFFRKIRPYKQRQEKIFETTEIKNYGESETNNNKEQNERTTIVPDAQDVSNNQVEENLSNSVRENFVLHGRGATKTNQRKNWLFTLRFWIYLA